MDIVIHDVNYIFDICGYCYTWCRLYMMKLSKLVKEETVVESEANESTPIITGGQHVTLVGKSISQVVKSVKLSLKLGRSWSQV